MPFDLTESYNIPNGKHLGTIIDFSTHQPGGTKKDYIEVKVLLTGGDWTGKDYKFRLYGGQSALSLAKAVGLTDKITTPDGKLNREYEPDPDDYLNEEIAFTASTPEPTDQQPKPFTNYTFFSAENYTEEEEEEAPPPASTGTAGRRTARR